MRCRIGLGRQEAVVGATISGQLSPRGRPAGPCSDSGIHLYAGAAVIDHVLVRILPCLILLALIVPSGASAAPRIVGGGPATQAYPAQAEVSPTIGGSEYLCGGTLVAPRWVLTAGHCATDDNGAVLAPTAFNVRLGSQVLDQGTSYQVNFVTRNPQWKPGGLAPSGDAALLHLAVDAPQTPLPVSGTVPAVGTPARTIGWGDTTDGGDLSQALQEVDVPIVSDPVCANAYPQDFIQATMICAGLPDGGKDSCQGDSGGPLMVPTGDTAAPWEQVGIVSSGDGCAVAGKYGIYTRLANASLQDWLVSAITGPDPTLAAAPAATPTPSPVPVATPLATPVPAAGPRAARVTLPKTCRAGTCKVVFDLPSGGTIRARLVLTRASASKLHRHGRSAGSAVKQFLAPTAGTLKVKLPKTLRKQLHGHVTAQLTVTVPAGIARRTVSLSR
ncbi:MAG: trypsin [Solirubrobacteraceae bacterium]|nr:trypsin [Solirubrobacteraceae bacterium]